MARWPPKWLRVEGATEQADQDMSNDFKQFRAQVSLEQRALLDRIWTVFGRSEPLAWPTSKSIHLRSSKTEVQGLLRDLPTGAVLLTPDDRYALTLLGLLLTRLGEVLEQVLEDFFVWLRREARKNPDIENITSQQVRAGIDEISDEESLLLGEAVFLGRFWDTTFMHGVAWSCGVPKDLDDLPPPEEMNAYIWARAETEAVGALARISPVANAPSDARSTSTTNHVPSAFLSYSWDSPPHKAWVRELAARLRQDGVEAILDQWETVLGDQLPVFMERALRENDYVLIICTPRYKQRSESRAGGVGYEGDIMTAEIVAQGNHRKFIPVLASGTWEQAAPSWLRGKYHIDLSGRPYADEQYRDLLTTLHGQRQGAPPIGQPFSTVDPRHAVSAADPPKPTSDDEDIRIEGVIVDEVTEPRNDGTRGSALYAVPLRLSRRPTVAWAELLVRNWNMPSTFTSMHRPGILSVRGDKVVLTGTTLEEIIAYHRETLTLVLAETNRQYRELAQQQRARSERTQQERDRHRRNIEEQARRLSFEDDD